MYVAMNRFKIFNGNESEFEKIWRGRDTHLNKVAGFIEFNLLKGSSDGVTTTYASHSTWQSKDHFKMWTKSEAFRKAHKGAGNRKDLYDGNPIFEGFESVV